MKMKSVAFLAAVLTVCSVATAAETRSGRIAVKALATVPTAELPAKAVSVVASASAEAREATAKAVVRRVAKSQPAALKHVVVALAKAHPELGPAIYTVAFSERPEMAGGVNIASADIAASVAKVSSNPVFASVGSAATSVDTSASIPSGGTITSAPGTILTPYLVLLPPPTPVGPGMPGAWDPIRYSLP